MTAPVLSSADAWSAAAKRLAAGELRLVSLWGDDTHVDMAVSPPEGGVVDHLRVEVANGKFPSVAAEHAPAGRLERTITDLYGHVPEGGPDRRPWLDHGRWETKAPLGRSAPPAASPAPYAFLSAEGPGLHQIPVGPVHAGIIEPGHFRFHASGETVVRLEERLGYVHKGVDALMKGADLARGAELAGRVSGDSTVSYAYAFALAAEAALGLTAPPKAARLRALMAELERVANHFGDVGAICNDASFAIMHAQCGTLRERVLRYCAATFGHRLMMDRVRPGGVAADFFARDAKAATALVKGLRRDFARLVELYDNTASLQDRTVGTGVIKAELAKTFGAGGYVGRASGRPFDARKAHPYAPYPDLKFETPLFTEGDVNARVWVRIREIEASLGLIEALVEDMPSGPFALEPPAARAAEGHALVEGFRGDVFAYVRLGVDGRIERCHLRDPSWFHWPLLEAAIEGNIVADFPLCNKSVNGSYSGVDL